jgi:hypothetical protein
MKKKIIYISIIIALFAGSTGFVAGRYKYPVTKIKVIEKIINKTEYKYKIETIKNFDADNFAKLLYCYDSEIKFNDYTLGNVLIVEAYDNCKEARAEYEIGTSGDWKIYAGVAIAGIGLGIAGYALLK